MELPRREVNVLAGTFVLTAILLATHLGEFWPFSIYPMFSKAGEPWTRALIVERGIDELPDGWAACLDMIGDADEASCGWPDEPFHPEHAVALSAAAMGVDPIDFANFVSKTRLWTRESAEAILTMTGGGPADDRVWFVYKVKGRIDPAGRGRGRDAFLLHMEPTVVFTKDGMLIRPPANAHASL